jgi:hypothetical protein
VPGVAQHRDDVGGVLALGGLRAQPPERRREQAAPAAVDRRVDLVDRELVGGGVGLLDDRGDVPVRVAHHPPVPGGVRHPCGEQRTGRVGEAVLAREVGQGLGPQQRSVAGDDDDVVLGVDGVGERGQRHAGGVARAPSGALLQ